MAGCCADADAPVGLAEELPAALLPNGS